MIPHILRLIRREYRRRFTDPASGANDPCWNRPFEYLGQKWHEVPTELRADTHELINLSDTELLSTWESHQTIVAQDGLYTGRSWYRDKYSPTVEGRHLVDFGSGLGFDSIHFAQVAAQVTCVDIVPENLEVIRRVARLLGRENINTHLVTGLDSFEQLPDGYDVLLAQGSLHHAPARVVLPEIQALARRLRPGGRWLQLAYPKSRWIREGCLPFHKWGEVTDGAGTPWAEWLDLATVVARMAPLEFDVQESFEFHQGAFIWFDLIKSGSA